MNVLKKIWEWIEYNRWTVILPVAGLIIWFTAIGCTPETASPLNPDRMVSAYELQTEFELWEKQQEQTQITFAAAGHDLQRQEEANEAIKQLIIKAASGGVADLPGLLQLLLTGGALGSMSDKIRKRGLIAGLKRNRES